MCMPSVYTCTHADDNVYIGAPGDNCKVYRICMHNECAGVYCKYMYMYRDYIN